MRSAVKPKAEIIIKNASQLLTIRGFQHRPKVGSEMNDLGIIENGALAIKDGRILWAGPTSKLTENVETSGAKTEIDAQGKTVLPGFIDTHNHLIFAGSKEDEFLQRVYDGLSYLEITARGGGVMKSVTATRAASRENLVFLGRKRVQRMLKEGMTTTEAKSGYGLNLPDEMKMLEVAHVLNQQGPLHVIPTFLAHGIPTEYKAKREEYVDLLTNEIIPEIGQKNLAKFCDIPYAPRRIFTEKECERILRKAGDLRMKPRIHADEFSDDGGAEFAAHIRAHTVDHCVYASDNGIKALQENGVMANLLPLIPFTLGWERYADARKMIDQGVAVALGTDFNSTFYSHSIMLAITLACLKMKLTPAEAINAATINAAHSVGEAENLGSIEAGKQADMIILDAPNYVFIPYSLGSAPVEMVFKNGILVLDNGQRTK
jgi:imidazolonepropionase